MPPRVVLAGGSGFVGRSLSCHLAELGYETLVLSRSAAQRPGFARWDGATVGDWAQHLEGAAAIINLAGRSVDCRHNPDNLREILASRVNSVRALGAAVRQSSEPPLLWIQATSLAIYGDPGDKVCGDHAAHGNGFFVDVCEQWESELLDQPLPHTRIALLRIGFALAAHGGALGKLAALTRFGLGGTVGSGRQYISWLHLEDLNRMFAWCLANPSAKGTYNATGPNPVTNAVFMAALRRALRRGWSPPAPSWAVRIGAYLMGSDASLALSGRRCLPTRLLEEGFSFKHPDLDECLRDVFSPRHQPQK